MTLVQLAVHCRQPLSAEWLVAGGAEYTALDAWDLDWKDRARQLLLKNPEHVNQRYREFDRTLLHVAAERNDQELAQLALSAGPDLHLKDTAWQATAFDWAKHFGHSDIMGMIIDAMR